MSGFRFRPIADREEARKLRVEQGDAVIFNGDVYLVVTAGMKYLRLQSFDGTSTLGLVKRIDVRKFSGEHTPSPMDEFKSTVPFDRSKLLKHAQALRIPVNRLPSELTGLVKCLSIALLRTRAGRVLFP